MKNILITGATGGIGSALIDCFYENEYNLFVKIIKNLASKEQLNYL